MKNKILSILCFVILISFLFINNSVFASENVFNPVPDLILEEIKNNEEYYNSNYYYIAYKWDNNYSVLFIEKTNSLKVHVYIENHNYLIINERFNGYIYTYNSSCSLTSSGLVENAQWSSRSNSGFFDNTISTNLNIYTDNTYTEIFFQGAPATILATELEKIQIVEVWTTLMKSVLVSLVVFLVGLVAFLKAWAWLKNQLRKA